MADGVAEGLEAAAQERKRKRSRSAEAANETMAQFVTATMRPWNPMAVAANAMKHYVESNQELIRFYSTRLKKNLATANSLAQCRSVDRASQVWTAAATDTAHDYADEFGRLLTINSAQPVADDSDVA